MSEEQHCSCSQPSWERSSHWILHVPSPHFQAKRDSKQIWKYLGVEIKIVFCTSWSLSLNDIMVLHWSKGKPKNTSQNVNFTHFQGNWFCIWRTLSLSVKGCDIIHWVSNLVWVIFPDSFVSSDSAFRYCLVCSSSLLELLCWTWCLCFQSLSSGLLVKFIQCFYKSRVWVCKKIHSIWKMNCYD